MTVKLIPYGEEDLWLTEALELDPDVMRELGGPRPKEELPGVHERRVGAKVDGEDWWFKIVAAPGDEAIGTIGIWPNETDGEAVYEAGWMLLPAHQGRGLASAALGMLLDRARAAGRFGEIHAFPGATNGASNALCRKFGFKLLGERETVFRDRMLKVNHWVLALDKPA
jgi:RimJ/RimL family protein N-acetyltransferase